MQRRILVAKKHKKKTERFRTSVLGNCKAPSAMQPLASHIIVSKVGLLKDLQTQKTHHPRFRCSRTPFSIVRGRVHNAIFITFFVHLQYYFFFSLGFFLFTTFFTTFVTNYFLFVISAGRGGRRFGHQNRILPPPTHNNRKGGKQFKTGRSCRRLLT
jgi:hypothetical protein